MTTEPFAPLHILMVTACLPPFAHDASCALEAPNSDRRTIRRDEHSAYAGRGVQRLAEALAGLGHDVRIVAPRYGAVDLGRIEAKGDIPPFTVPMGHRRETATVYRARLAGITVYLVDDPRYFGVGASHREADDGERYVYLSRVALELVRRAEVAWRPDIVHCHDWQTGLVPNYLHTIYRGDPALADAASVFTVHDLEHQGILGYRVLELAGLSEYGFYTHPEMPDLDELVNLLARGVMHADVVTTVSETYAQEVQTPEYGERLHPLFRQLGERLVGILNGADAEGCDPGEDALLASPYTVETLERRAANKAALQRALRLPEDARAPLIGLASRLEPAQGWDLLHETLAPMVANLGVQVAVLGAGDQRYEDHLAELARRFPGGVRWVAVPEACLEHLLYAGSDIYLVPARVEPNGTGHLLAMHYGAVPVVRATGGLADAVRDYDADRDAGNGFRFEAYDPWALYTAVVRAVEVYRHPALWQGLQRRCMAHDISWSTTANRYVEAYRWAREHRRLRAAQGGGG